MSKRLILVTEPFRPHHMEKINKSITEDYEVLQLEQGFDEDTYKEWLKKAEVIVGQPSMEELQNLEENCPKLKLIQMTWAGTDQYTRSSLPFPEGKVSLANASGTYGMIISQFVVGQILSMMLHFKTYHTQQEKMVWARRGPVLSLENAKVLIYGAGDIGTMTAKRLKSFDCYTIGICRNVNKERPYFDELCTLEEAEKYLPEVDVVVGCIPNSKETECYMNQTRLSMMKETGILVNVGRGNFIDCMALDEILKAGKLWGAALDVTEPEPLPENHPLWNNPQCMITPHASGGAFDMAKETEDLLCSVVCDNIVRYCNGQEINNRIY